MTEKDQMAESKNDIVLAGTDSKANVDFPVRLEK